MARRGRPSGARWTRISTTARWASSRLRSTFRTPQPAKATCRSLLFDYRPVPLNIIDNGHTIQVNYAPGSFVMVAGRNMSCSSSTSTSPARRRSTARARKWAPTSCTRVRTASPRVVVAVQLDAGAENPLIKTLWNNLPKEKGKENAAPAVMINAMDLLPKNKGYYTLSGSLTTPPCSEDVTWSRSEDAGADLERRNCPLREPVPDERAPGATGQRP